MSKVSNFRKLLLVLFCALTASLVLAEDVPLPLPPGETASEPEPFNLVDIIAQRNMNENSYNTITQSRGMHLGGVHIHKYDASRRALYLYDSGNSRILAFNNPDWTNPSDLPDKAFGQKDSFDTGACNGNNNDPHFKPTARTFCLHSGAYAISREEEPKRGSVDTDPNGNLYVLDQHNNRVLMFLDPFGTDPGEGDTSADGVWGQPDMTSKSCNRGAGLPHPGITLTDNSLCMSIMPTGVDNISAASVDIDKWGNLWVGDIINNRVLRFPYDSTTGRPRLTADLVLGQPDMQSYVYDQGSCVWSDPGTSFCPLFYVKVHDVTGEVYIMHNFIPARITVFTPNQTSQNPQWYSYNRTIGLGELTNAGYFGFLDGNRLLIEDELEPWQDGFRIYTTQGTYIRTITDASVIGSTPDSQVNWVNSQGQFSIIDNMLFLNEQFEHNSILVFDISKLDSHNQLTYRGELLGGTNHLWNTTTGLGVRSNFGLAASDKHQQVFVVDNFRILVWNMVTPYAGRRADFVIGQPDFTSNSIFSEGAFIFRESVKGIAIDEANNKLWVSRFHEIYAFDLPITANTPVPVITIWGRIPDSVFEGTLPVRGQPDNYEFLASDMAFNSTDQTLWLLDTENNRAAQVINPYTNPMVNLIVGQNDINGRNCNRGVFTSPTAKTLCFPFSAAFDKQGNLYIAEGVYEGRDDKPGNKRVVEYDKATIDSAAALGLLAEPAANRVYGVPSFTTNPITNFTCLPDTPCNPIAIDLSPDGSMVVLSDAYFNDQNRRIYIYNDPLRNPGYVEFDSEQDLMLPYSMGQGGFPAYADVKNLFLQDHTWNRVMVVNGNKPPAAPAYIQPLDGAAEQPLDTVLQWDAAVDPNNDPVSYNVYLGQDEADLELIASDQNQTSYTSNLTGSTTYYWQIGATDGLEETTGPVWSFTTVPGPSTVTYISPLNGTNTQSLGVNLQWNAATVPIGQTVTYDVLVGTTPDELTVVAADQSTTNYQLVMLAESSTYYWQIHSRSQNVTNKASEVWSFSTLSPVDLLVNGDFELDNDLNKIPDGWTQKNPTGDKSKCNSPEKVIAFKGNCAYVFKAGPAEKSQLVQVVNFSQTPLNLNDTLKLNWVVNAKGTVQTTVKIKIRYANGEKANTASPLFAVTGQYQSFNIDSTLIAVPVFIRVQLINKSTTGKIFYDAVSLKVYPPTTASGLNSDLIAK